MAAKWILGLMITVMIMAALAPLCPGLWVSLGNYAGTEYPPVFLWIVNFGIITAVLCIVLFLLYVLVKRSRRY